MITRWWLLAAPDLPRLGGGGVEGGDGDGRVRLQRRQGPRGAAQAEVQGRSVERLHPSVCRWEGAGGSRGASCLVSWQIYKTGYCSSPPDILDTPWLNCLIRIHHSEIWNAHQEAKFQFSLKLQHIIKKILFKKKFKTYKNMKYVRI